jgi:hypothetical protein
MKNKMEQIKDLSKHEDTALDRSRRTGITTVFMDHGHKIIIDEHNIIFIENLLVIKEHSSQCCYRP